MRFRLTSRQTYRLSHRIWCLSHQIQSTSRDLKISSISHSILSCHRKFRVDRFCFWPTRAPPFPCITEPPAYKPSHCVFLLDWTVKAGILLREVLCLKYSDLGENKRFKQNEMWMFWYANYGRKKGHLLKNLYKAMNIFKKSKEMKKKKETKWNQHLENNIASPF